jgi:hypothetical protein
MAVSAGAVVLAGRTAVGFFATTVRDAFAAAGLAFGFVVAVAVAVVSDVVSITGVGSVTMVVSAAAGAVPVGGGGAIVIGSGSIVGGGASCDHAGVEVSARAAAIAGRALAYAYRLVFHIMPVQPSSRRSGCAIIADPRPHGDELLFF